MCVFNMHKKKVYNPRFYIYVLYLYLNRHYPYKFFKKKNTHTFNSKRLYIFDYIFFMGNYTENNNNIQLAKVQKK